MCCKMAVCNSASLSANEKGSYWQQKVEEIPGSAEEDTSGKKWESTIHEDCSG